MKNTFLVIALGATSVLSANGDPQLSSCPGGNCSYSQYENRLAQPNGVQPIHGQPPHDQTQQYNQYQQQPQYQAQPYQAQPYQTPAYQAPAYQGQYYQAQPYQAQPYHQGYYNNGYYNQGYYNPQAAQQPYYQNQGYYQGYAQPVNAPQLGADGQPVSQPTNTPDVADRDRSDRLDNDKQTLYDKLKGDRDIAYNALPVSTPTELPLDETKGTADQEIAKKIQTTLASGWLSHGYKNVSFSISNGHVVLKGEVDTSEDKAKVEESIKNIDGVKTVDSQIAVAKTTASNDSKVEKYEQKYPQDVAVSDQDRVVNAKIRDKLNGGWFAKGYQTLVIKTNNGQVTVIGVVDSFDDLKKIGDDIKQIDGVKSVNNQLTVTPKK